MNERTNKQTNGRMNERKDERTKGRTNERTNERTNQRRNKQTKKPMGQSPIGCEKLISEFGVSAEGIFLVMTYYHNIITSEHQMVEVVFGSN